MACPSGVWDTRHPICSASVRVERGVIICHVRCTLHTVEFSGKRVRTPGLLQFLQCYIEWGAQ